jgi:hypothetical protein
MDLSKKKELSYQVYRLFPVFSDVFSMRRHQIFDSRFTEDVFLVAIERLELDDVSEIHLQEKSHRGKNITLCKTISQNIN